MGLLHDSHRSSSSKGLHSTLILLDNMFQTQFLQVVGGNVERTPGSLLAGCHGSLRGLPRNDLGLFCLYSQFQTFQQGTKTETTEESLADISEPESWLLMVVQVYVHQCVCMMISDFTKRSKYFFYKNDALAKPTTFPFPDSLGRAHVGEVTGDGSLQLTLKVAWIP